VPKQKLEPSQRQATKDKTMADTEKLHFKIGLSGTYWDKHPIYTILVNDKIAITGKIDAESDVTEFIEFDQEIEEGTSTLSIRLENKENSDVVQNEDKTTIVKDLLLNIVSVEIDEIDLGHLIHSKSTFTGDEGDRPVLTKCVNLGWNGTWTLTFDSPFYIWLLENI
jgi:predicted AlkP superfamily phosphohydrolase/phosphomutase